MMLLLLHDHRQFSVVYVVTKKKLTMGDKTAAEPQEDKKEVAPSKIQEGEDDEEENDEDYKPEEDPDAEGDDEMEVDDETTDPLVTPLMDPRKRKAVDLAFERLFGYEWGTEFALDEDSLKSPGVQQLVGIFGPNMAAKILESPVTPGTKRRKILATTNQLNLPTPTIATIENNSVPIVVPVSKPQAVMETKVFAGQAIQVPRQPPKGNAANAQGDGKKSSVAGGGGSSKLDNVLAQLAGPSKLSTVQKTSDDWEQFKQTDKQLQEELERKAQSKDAFLVKQDFLNRVDQRRFELEKEVRDRERAKRGK